MIDEYHIFQQGNISQNNRNVLTLSKGQAHMSNVKRHGDVCVLRMHFFLLRLLIFIPSQSLLKIQGKCYKIKTDELEPNAMRWGLANELCKADGGTLASIKTPEDFHLLKFLDTTSATDSVILFGLMSNDSMQLSYYRL